MTAAGRKTGRRYGRESQQEDRSEAQIRERFADLGWPCDRLGRDLGEDLHVRIYDDGQSTGLAFLVQLKSAADAERLKRKKSPALAYRLDVKDLLHWEVSTTLVVLVVWDVEKRTGWWRPVPEMIAELDKAGKAWRRKKTATVTVPLGNGADEEGMTRLRWAVADYCLPIVPKGDMSKVELSFPRTPEGAEAIATLRRAFETGQAAEVIALKIEHPEWHRRIYGAFDGPARIKIAASERPVTIPVRVDLESSHGIATVPHIELRRVELSEHGDVLSNEHQDLNVQLRVVVSNGGCEASIRITGSGRNVYEAQEIAAVAWVMAQSSVNVRLTARVQGEPTTSFHIEAPLDDAMIERLRAWRAFVDKLAFVQHRLPSQVITLPKEGVSHADAAAVERAFVILSQGVERATTHLSFAFVPRQLGWLSRDLRAESPTISIGEGVVEAVHFMNVDFEPGAYRVFLEEPRVFLAECERSMRAVQGRDEAVRVEMERVPILLQYIRWLPEQARWDRLVRTAKGQEGYVTLSQAQWAGYSDDVFLALLPAGKIEPVASDVYHLAHFPHADREDLIVLWLQTDRRGVVSHETALALHDLCDILPSHLHITVPPGWTPQDRQLTADVEIRHADVPEADLRWLGPVPYTAPLRTVRDCIEVGVSPELIEQAIAEGIRRGLFTEADFPHLQRAESA